MTNSLKKHEFLLPFARLFTHGEKDAYESIAFQPSQSFGEEEIHALASPLSWGTEAVGIMAEAACASIPAETRAVEENTVPSWLWHRHGRKAGLLAEGDLRDIFNRVVGSAAAKAWKLNLFSSEKTARAFYDEARFAFMQRHVAIAPDIIASWGLDWAYGIEAKVPAIVTRDENQAPLSNAAIDGLIGKNKNAALWKNLFAVSDNKASTVTLRLSDIAADWHSPLPCPARAAIDLMALRHNDGSVNIDALRQAARLLSVLLDLQGRSDVTIGLANLAPLLLALGLAYDSDAARALAASVAALVTAECVAASAEMAGLRGASKEFANDRDAVMRSLRNHRRAVYGDGNDYEKLSVLPAPLPLKNCPDLALVAEAQRVWDAALAGARAYGLRAVQATDLTPSPVLAVLMSSASQGLEPMQRLTGLQQESDDNYRVILHPAVGEALTRLDYPRHIATATMQHIVGTHSLIKAPAINHTTLRAAGLNEAAIEKIEAYLPCVDRLGLAMTPWIVGVDFCLTVLKIPANKWQAPRFDLLRHLGFSDTDIKATNLFCYGHGTVRNAKILHLRHRPLFACGTEVSAEARIRMAAAVQSFVSGDASVTAHLPTTQSVERGAEITLTAWRCGLKSLTVAFDPTMGTPLVRKAAGRRIKAEAQPQEKRAGAIKRVTKSRRIAGAASRRSPERRVHK